MTSAVLPQAEGPLSLMCEYSTRTFASRAMALSVPAEGLFIDRDAYAWRAAALAGIVMA